MQKYNGFDATTQNAVLLLFIGYDKDILVRNDYTTWNIKGTKHNDFDKAEVIPISDFDTTDRQTEWVVNNFKKQVEGINDEAHPQIRSYSVALGGYVSGGYISYSDAVSLAHSLISSNSYMQKGVAGYQKTAEQSIKIGMQKPIKFKE